MVRGPRLPMPPRRSDLEDAAEQARLARARARDALRTARVRLEEAHASGKTLRRARQLRSDVQEQLAIARDRLAMAKRARNGFAAGQQAANRASSDSALNESGRRRSSA